MNDPLERLAAANPVRTDGLAPSIEAVWHRLDDDPAAHPTRRGLRRAFGTPQPRRYLRLAPVGAGVAAVSAALLVVGTTGGGPTSAFAGWTVTPTTPVSGETSGALTKCTSQLGQIASVPSGATTTPTLPAGGWQPVITDTRGPFTAMVLQSGSARASCLSGPSFTNTATYDAGTGAHVQGAESSVAGSGSAGGSSAASSGTSVATFGSSSGLITQASQTDLTFSGGRPYTFVQGQLATGVTAVTLALSDGSDVQATVGGGSFIAWWPGGASVTSAQIQAPSGVVTQQITFSTPPSAPGIGGSSPN